uniref:Calcium channel, voltage-dependent, gamma subunit 8a n=1 Tax=Cyclopterus lumpus TaxID=8103 RepID=A0A8C2ZID3_CYCLU
MVWCERGIQVLTANSSQDDSNNKDKKDPGALTHSGLWRICCLEGLKRGVCSQINHFPDDADYDQDSAEYLLRVVRASSIFPILSAILLLLGGVCVASSSFYKSKRNIVLGGGILFVAAGLSNIIGVIVYISAALSDISPKKDEDKKWHYSYGWSFYFGGLSFILAEMVGVLAVNIYIEKNKELRCRSRADLFKSTTHAVLRLPSYRFRRRSRSSSRSTDPPHSQEASPIGGGGGDISMYTLTRDSKLGSLGGGAPPLYGTVDRATLYQLHNYFPKESSGGSGGGGTQNAAPNSDTLNRKTTPV